MSEKNLHGEPLTIHPRFECADCGAFVYATWPRGWERGGFRLECECRSLRPSDAPAEPWSRSY